MNILIPHKWLSEHVETQAGPELISEKLSLCGPTVERINSVRNDSVYDIEVTTNRVDSMSVRGIAREIAAILPEFDIQAKFLPLHLPKVDSGNSLDIKIENNPKLCHRILAIKLSDLVVEDSPGWLKDRLTQVGQRSLNNLIDITNYVMWEIGHPIHIFDYDKIRTKKIIVREASRGELITTLDGITHKLLGGEVIFDDGRGSIIDLPGIMGTKNTVVGQDTKNALLWIESVDAVKIRQASMNLAIRSQAAVLNEKSVDTELGLTAILRAIDYYKKIVKAKISSELVDLYPRKPNIKSIALQQCQVDTYLGVKVKPDKIEQILSKLGCQVLKKQDIFHVTPPSFRNNDLLIPQDIIEEIARIYGYHNLPSVVMNTPIPDNPSPENFRLEYQLKTWLQGWGLNEIYTYSMVSKKLALQSEYPLKQHLQIKNPLTDEWIYMRRSLIPSLIEVLKENQRENLTVFEMQNVYQPSKKPSALPVEELQLVIVTTQNYRYLKGLLDALIKKLFIDNLTVEPNQKSVEGFDPQKSAFIFSDASKLGIIGKLNNQPFYALKLVVEKLSKVSNSHPRYIPLINTPPIIEDLTFSLPIKTYLGHFIDEIKLTSDLVEKVELTDKYAPKKSPTVNYTFKISYRNPEKPLSDKEIAPIRKRIVSLLQKNFKAELVGKLD